MDGTTTDGESPTPAANGDSGISLAQHQPTASRACKEFDVSTVWCCYDAVNFLQNPQSVVILKSDSLFPTVVTVLYVIS